MYGILGATLCLSIFHTFFWRRNHMRHWCTKILFSVVTRIECILRKFVFDFI